MSYYAHRLDSISSPLQQKGGTSQPSNPFHDIAMHGPPAPPRMMQQYRTIGSIDQHFQMILSRFSNEAYFHDIFLS